MSPADIIGFMVMLIVNPFSWLFIVFWIIYKKTKKDWVLFTAILFTIISFLTFIATVDTSFTHIILK